MGSSHFSLYARPSGLGVRKARAAVKSFYHLSRKTAYQELIKTSEHFPFSIPNDSVLMAYDFHANENTIQLVEINTNASGYLLAALMTSVHSNKTVRESAELSELQRSFSEDGLRPGARIAIVDDDVAQQKMLLEFLMYRDLFVSWGNPAMIGEAGDLRLNSCLTLKQQEIDFVYNRTTDFYFDREEHADLRDAWKGGQTIVSPQPREYFLLADKERLIDFAQISWLERAGASKEEIEAISEVAIPTFGLGDFESPEKLWAQRRNLFFKPKHSHGGKSVYRGESVSRKVFDRLIHEDVLIQKFVPAGHIPGIAPGDPLENWKFDLRFFVYRDRIQQVVARIYQGQVTNFASPLGGFTSVRFT